MKRLFFITGTICAITIMAIVITACGGGTSTAASGASGTSNVQVLPVADNPIQNSSTTPGLEIVKAEVENNVDPGTSKDISDRLQLSVKNTSGQKMDNLEIFYRLTDSTTRASEGYYQKLDGLSLAPGETKTIYFDNQTGPGHYPENKYSMYRTSTNEVVFTIELSAPGFKLAAGDAKKDAGTGEKQGE